MEVLPKVLQDARDQFESMLKRDTIEPEWQTFFAAHPYVITPSLPLRLEPRDIIPLGRPGKTEPDFIFYSNQVFGAPSYGLIELKRPDHKIATIPRKNTAILSHAANLARKQSLENITEVPALLAAKGQLISDANLILGSNQYLFVIIGKSDDKIFQPGNELLLKSIRNDLPSNLQILPYDLLFRNFDKSIYRQIHILVPQPPIVAGFIRLRSQPTILSLEAMLKMLQEKGFYDSSWHFVGTGVKHQYRQQVGGRVVHDATADLTWQQGGSEKEMPLNEAHLEIEKLNSEGYGGCSDWRLPTLEEAMSLMEPEKNDGYLHIDPVFDAKQPWIWTTDKTPVGSVWLVNFFLGGCFNFDVNVNVKVRAVRS